MIFSFPDSTERFKAGSPPLIRAVVAVHYPLVAAFAQLAGLSTLQEHLRGRFPVLQPAQTTAHPGLPNTITSETTEKKWLFSSESGYQLHLTAGSIELSIGSEYKTREDFSDVLMLALESLQATGLVLQCEKIVVRYINASPTEEDWSLWWHPQVLGWISSPYVKAGKKYNVTQTLLDDCYVTAQDVSVQTHATIRHGLVRGPEFPAHGNFESFVLDCELTSRQTTPFVPSLINEIYTQYNHEIAKFFSFAVSEQGRKRFAIAPK